MIDRGIDTDDDGTISAKEASAVGYLDVSSCDIKDMRGIELFVNLVMLYCGGNQITSLDLSGNPVLTYLYCQTNLLTTLDVTSNTALTRPGCNSNNLTALDVLQNTALERLACGLNQLSTLNLSHNTSLTYLSIGYMPSLTGVCVWTMPFPPGDFDLSDNDSPNY